MRNENGNQWGGMECEGAVTDCVQRGYGVEASQSRCGATTSFRSKL